MNPAFLCGYHLTVLNGFASKTSHLTVEDIEGRALVLYRQCWQCQGLASVPQEHLGHDMPYKGSEAHFDNLRAAC